MKSTKNLILNISGHYQKKVVLNEKESQQIRFGNYKINDDLKEALNPEFLKEELDNCSYIIRGGSSLDGCPMHHSLHSRVPKKIFKKKRKNISESKKRKMPRWVTEKISVLDIKAVALRNKSQFVTNE